MNITIVHGQNHTGSSYHIGRLLAERLTSIANITEFFLPRDLNHQCLGCYSCVEDESHCPYSLEKNNIEKQMEEADVLIFTTPTYCLDCSGAMKAFIDLFFQNWIFHRPKATFFRKKAVVISCAAGIGTDKAIATIKKTLFYWGIPFIKTYGVSVQAKSWSEVSSKKKDKIEKQINKLAKKIENKKVGNSSIFIKLMFNLTRKAKMASTQDDYDFYEAEYWEKQGWFTKKRPYNKK